MRDYVGFTQTSALLRALLTHPATINMLIQGNPTQRRWSLLLQCHQRHVQQTQFAALAVVCEMRLMFVRMFAALFMRQDRQDSKEYENYAADKNRRLTGKVKTRPQKKKKLHRRKSVIITPALYSEGLVFDSRSRSRLFVQPNAGRCSLAGTSSHFFITSLPFDAI